MRFIKRYSESTVRMIVNKVLGDVLNEEVGYEAPMSLDELKDALIGKRLSMKVMDLDSGGEWVNNFDEKIYDVEDWTDELNVHKTHYALLFSPGLWCFNAQELTTLATRGRLYKNAWFSDSDVSDNPNERWLFEIH